MLGLEFVEGTAERVVGRLTVDGRHLQPFGIIHGGVHAAIAESAASYGASLAAAAMTPGSWAAGLENHTTFLRAARRGATLEVVATPLHAGRRTQSWRVTITDTATGRALAHSTVRLIVLTAADELGSPPS